MTHLKLSVVTFFLFCISVTYGQLGFCGGSTGDAIFSESFGNGTNYGPALSPGITTYNFIAGAPQDSFYTLFYRTNLLGSWHNSPDHSPDATDGPNGKCLIVNANNNNSGSFYRRIVTGLCVNTTFEFSAWVLNVYNFSSNICTNNEIPVNVRFEIWNETQTTLLGSGNTGNIFSTSSPLWQQYALVFTTTNQTSVVLIMKNNGVGGCGNDLAIDDIAFKSCGDLTTVSNPSFPNNTFTTCSPAATVNLAATTNGSSSYFYQWQSSADNENWTDIIGENSNSFTTPGVTATTYFRTKIAQDIANINSAFCSTVSNAFSVIFSGEIPPALSDGDVDNCNNQPNTPLSVTTSPGNAVNWFDQLTGGNLLLAGSTTFTPPSAGTYYAEVFNPITGCYGTNRTAVTLSIYQGPVATFTGSLNYCSGENTAIVFASDTDDTTFSWTVASTNVTGASNGTGTFITQNLTANGAAGSVTYLVTPEIDGCPGPAISILVNVLPLPTATFEAASSTICINETVTLLFEGTPNGIVNFTDGTANYTVTLQGDGFGTFATSALTNDTTFTLISVEVTEPIFCLQNITGSITITIEEDPVITTHPLDETICSNESTTFNVVATGTNLTYQWLLNGTPIETATDATYVIQVATISDAGDYTVAISGNCTTTLTLFSEIATLILIAETSITEQPQVFTTICAGENLNLSVTATGTNLIYQWFNGNVPIAGATAAIYDVLASTVADSGSYTCQVTSTLCGTIISDAAVVVVNEAVGIADQDGPEKICVGETATFTVTATGTNLTYQWFKDNTAILGATSNTFTITNANEADSGSFYCEVSSISCQEMQTDSIALLVKSVPFATISEGTSSFICEGESAQIIFNGTANAIVTYTINGGTEESITLVEGLPTIVTTEILNETTVYELVSVTFNEQNACTQAVVGSVTVTVNPLPSVSLEDGTICVDPITLATTKTFLLNTGLNDAEFTFEWFDTNGTIALATNSFYEVSATGQYSVAIKNITTGCKALAFANVGQSLQPTDFRYTVSGFFAGNPTLVITATPAGQYEYQLDFGPFQDSNTFENITAGTHIISVRDAEACAVLSKEILIIDYPRFFTPNGDGINDLWNIPAISTISITKIDIFDKFGKLIKQMSAAGSGWDGTYNGQFLPATDYWFIINYQEDGVNKEFQSHFSLKR